MPRPTRAIASVFALLVVAALAATWALRGPIPAGVILCAALFTGRAVELLDRPAPREERRAARLRRWFA